MTSRITRESKTVAVMISFYCRHHHPTDKPCLECRELIDFAVERLKICPFQEGKTTCAKCRVHCYRPDMRTRIRKVMKYSGPRMATRHPIMAIYHFIDSRRRTPLKPSIKATKLQLIASFYYPPAESESPEQGSNQNRDSSSSGSKKVLH